MSGMLDAVWAFVFNVVFVTICWVFVAYLYRDAVNTTRRGHILMGLYTVLCVGAVVLSAVKYLF